MAEQLSVETLDYQQFLETTPKHLNSVERDCLKAQEVTFDRKMAYDIWREAG